MKEIDGYAIEALGVNLAEDMVRAYRDYIDGKRVRGALVELGYVCGGGKREDVLGASVAVEINHHFLLMHDDVMDRDVMRHGKDSMQVRYGKLGALWGSIDGTHYGESMAVTLGDIGAFWGMKLLSELEIDAERKLKGLGFLSDYLVQTGMGQALDISLELASSVRESEVLQMYLCKTGMYTIAGPLMLGGILAGVDESVLDAMKVYGERVGVAFQMRDDELGLWGDEQKLGKPVGSDVRENKHTLLKLKVLELATTVDAEYLRKMYGNSEITIAELDRVREIHETSGALDYSQKKCQELLLEGKEMVHKITDDPGLSGILLELADYVIARDH